MEDRFGEKAKANGDVFSDLFVENNQNRTSGNMESIWVMQFEYTLLVAVQIPMTGHAVPGNPNTSKLPVCFGRLTGWPRLVAIGTNEMVDWRRYRFL